MARKKRRSQLESAAETLDQIESKGDRLIEWVGENPMVILGTALVILLVAGVWGFTAQKREADRDASAAALAQVQGDYRVAMGATPGSLQIPEPANPETGRRAREDYVAKYLEVAETYPGTTVAALALLDAGGLQQELGRNEEARGSFERALREAPPDALVRPFLLTRLAALHGVDGQWAKAAEAYEQASNAADYPLRYEALADAARAYAEAGDAPRALAAYARIQSDAPNYRLAPHLEARMSELRSSLESR